jgi:hypothetical protein
MNIFKKIIITTLTIIILIVIGILVQRFILQRNNVFYGTTAYDYEDCIIEEIEEIKSNQELCVESSNLIPAKVYYSEGWKVVCCKKR